MLSQAYRSRDGHVPILGGNHRKEGNAWTPMSMNEILTGTFQALGILHATLLLTIDKINARSVSNPVNQTYETVRWISELAKSRL